LPDDFPDDGHGLIAAPATANSNKASVLDILAYIAWLTDFAEDSHVFPFSLFGLPEVFTILIYPRISRKKTLRRQTETLGIVEYSL
jgi:hypothetical protein